MITEKNQIANIVLHVIVMTAITIAYWIVLFLIKIKNKKHAIQKTLQFRKTPRPHKISKEVLRFKGRYKIIKFPYSAPLDSSIQNN